MNYIRYINAKLKNKLDKQVLDSTTSSSCGTYFFWIQIMSPLCNQLNDHLCYSIKQQLKEDIENK